MTELVGVSSIIIPAFGSQFELFDSSSPTLVTVNWHTPGEPLELSVLSESLVYWLANTSTDPCKLLFLDSNNYIRFFGWKSETQVRIVPGTHSGSTIRAAELAI